MGTVEAVTGQGEDQVAGRTRDAPARRADGRDVLVEALELRSRADAPFDRARTSLALGVWLRVSDRPAQATTHLHHALAVFERLGADAWADRARGELVRNGELAAMTQPWWEVLTAQEVQVALLVAEGATNKAAAAALYISPKTIEYHLSRVYSRVGVRSRSELARLVARAGPPEPAILREIPSSSAGHPRIA
jgi:DNA-binding CsgD family transcriptional regulator